MKKQKSVAATINAALKSGDTARPIIGRDAHAPKAGNGAAAKKTLTALVKEAKEAAEDAERAADSAEELELQAAKYAAKAILVAVASAIALLATIIITINAAI